MLSNHRTPRSTWGDLHAMIGSLELGRAAAAARCSTATAPARCSRSAAELIATTASGWMRRRIEAIPDGDYAFEDAMEDDGSHARAGDDARPRRRRGDRAIVDFTGSDPQARGPVNATYGVTVSATCNAFLQVDRHRRSRATPAATGRSW